MSVEVGVALVLAMFVLALLASSSIARNVLIDSVRRPRVGTRIVQGPSGEIGFVDDDDAPFTRGGAVSR